MSIVILISEWMQHLNPLVDFGIILVVLWAKRKKLPFISNMAGTLVLFGAIGITFFVVIHADIGYHANIFSRWRSFMKSFIIFLFLVGYVPDGFSWKKSTQH